MTPGRRHRRRGVGAWPALLAAALAVGWGAALPGAARAQLPGLGLPDRNAPPAGVRRAGLVETTSIDFEGLPLFDVASPLVADRDRPDGVPVEVRAETVEAHLAKLREMLVAADSGRAAADPTAVESGALSIEVVSDGGQVSLAARGAGLAAPLSLVTVTRIDAERQQTPREELAAQWRGRIAGALSRAVRERRPDAARRRSEVVRNLAVAVALFHALLYSVSRLLLRSQDRLRAEIEAAAAGSETSGAPAPSGAARRTAPSRESRFRLLAFLRWLLFWAVFAAWAAGGTLALFQFPETRRFALYLTATPVLGVTALFAAGLANRLTDLAVDRALAGWQANRLAGGADDAARSAARLSTLSGVARALKLVVIYGAALFWILGQLDVVPWSVVTLGAMAALALSFAAQSVVKDVVVGALILAEDQYAIGDTVSLLDVTGTVEYMNLRITRVRTADGRLVTIPNSAVTKVENHSRDWSAVVVTFDVPAGVGADAAVALARGVAREMAGEPRWRDQILDPEQWAGVSALTGAGVTAEIAVRTRPLRQGAVGRELRQRVRAALDAAARPGGPAPAASAEKVADAAADREADVSG